MFTPFLFLKSLHLIFVITWFAALFYLPRLFVYHAELAVFDPCQEESHLRFCTMERRLFWGIMTPSAILTLIIGCSLILSAPINAYRHHLWLPIKLILVGFLLGYHYLCARYMNRFKNNKNTHSAFFFRCFNEIPTVILISIIFLAMFKP